MPEQDDRLIGLTESEQRIRREREWATPDTLRGQEIEQAEAQQGFLANLADGAADTAAAAGLRRIRDEGTRIAEEIGYVSDDNLLAPVINPAVLLAGSARALFGERHGNPDYDKDKEYDRLTQGIPVYLHGNIMSGDSLGAAERSRQRIIDEIERGQRMAQQKGASATFALLAGSVADVDLPLSMMTGGGFKAATIARKALKLAQKAGLGAKGGTRLATAAVGANAGLQAGALVGVADANWSETRDWTTVGEVALQSMLMGSILNGAVNGDKHVAILAAQKELHERIIRDDPFLNQNVDVESFDISPIMRDEPFLMDENGDFVEVPEVGDNVGRKEHAVDRRDKDN